MSTQIWAKINQSIIRTPKHEKKHSQRVSMKIKKHQRPGQNLIKARRNTALMNNHERGRARNIKSPHT